MLYLYFVPIWFCSGLILTSLLSREREGVLYITEGARSGWRKVEGIDYSDEGVFLCFFFLLFFVLSQAECI